MRDLSHRLFLNFYFFLIFWLLWVFTATSGLSLVEASRVYSLATCSTPASHSGSLSCGRAQAVGFSSCSSWALEHRLNCGRCMGSVAPRHVESSQTRDWTCVPCLGRQIPIHCTEVRTSQALRTEWNWEGKVRWSSKGKIVILGPLEL